MPASAQLVWGQETETFRRYPEPARAHLSFSVMYNEDGSTRSLDLTCETDRDFEYWYFGIKARARGPFCALRACAVHKARRGLRACRAAPLACVSAAMNQASAAGLDIVSRSRWVDAPLSV